MLPVEKKPFSSLKFDLFLFSLNAGSFDVLCHTCGHIDNRNNSLMVSGSEFGKRMNFPAVQQITTRGRGGLTHHLHSEAPAGNRGMAMTFAKLRLIVFLRCIGLDWMPL